MTEPKSLVPLDRLTGLLLGEPSDMRRFGIAVLTFAIAVLARHAFDETLPENVPYITFFPAIVVTALLAGSLPATCVLAGSAIYAWLVFMTEATSLAQKSIATLIFLLIGGAFVALVNLLRAALAAMKQAEEEATRLASARDLMFHELQHRVLNNLQMISSTLNLQRNTITDDSAKAALKAAIGRIRVVAALQRKLGEQGAERINLAQHLRETLHEAAGVSLGAGQQHVEMTILGEGPMVGGKDTLLLSLVITELVANAIEHGITPGGARIEVNVTCGKTSLQRGFAEIRDNGPGLPPGFDVSTCTSTGLRLAKLFVQQLDGSLNLSSDKGCIARLEFPLTDRHSTSAPVSFGRNASMVAPNQ